MMKYFYISKLFQSKVNDFLVIVSSTIESYIQTYKDDVPQEQSEETQFILGLCGIITSKYESIPTYILQIPVDGIDTIH